MVTLQRGLQRVSIAGVTSGEACVAACRTRLACNAAQFEPDSRRCIIFRSCLERRPDPGAAVFHRRSAGVSAARPAGLQPREVVWTTNASLVLVSYQASLSWLRTLPAELVDLVVYQKLDAANSTEQDGGPAMSDAISARLGAHLTHQESCSSGHWPRAIHRPQHERCPEQCACGRRWTPLNLAYFATVPNHGSLAPGEPRGGAREPHGYLRFILDFWTHLPPVVIFTQDDCPKRGCPWGARLDLLGSAVRDWPSHWGSADPPTRANCFCRWIAEENYLPPDAATRDRGYFWYEWMSFAQTQLFNGSTARHGPRLDWPSDATFAVGRGAIRAQPRWAYEALLRVLTVEKACRGASSLTWAHTIERLWFEVLDRTVAKVPLRSCFTEGARVRPRNLPSRPHS